MVTMNTNTHDTFRENLINQLEYHDWTVAELARRAHVNASTLRGFVNRNTSTITIDMAYWVAKALDVSLDRLTRPKDF
jgi:transcriptional regulator with XRE-family HTH domain